MGDFRDDLRNALRLFVAKPGFTIAVVAALALGIGADTAFFSVVNTVLLKPPGYPEQDRIVQIWNKAPDGEFTGASVPKFHVWQEQTSVFSDVEGYDGGVGMNLTGGIPEQVHGMHATEGYFRVFGAPFSMGRGFTKEEDRPNGGKVVVVSGGLWKRKYGSDPNLIGKSISIANLPYTVIGVTGPDFHTDPATDL